MLAANEAVAELLAKAELHFLRRVHQAPDPRKLKALTEFVTGLGFQVESLESRFELQKLLADVAGQPEQHAVNYSPAAQPATGRLQPRGGRPLRPGQRVLLPLHLADPPLSRPDDPSAARRADDRQEAAQRFRRAGRAGRALLRPRAAGRGRRARADQGQAARLPEHADRHELDAVVTGVEEFGLFVQGHRAAGRGADPRQLACTTTSTASTAPRTRSPAIAPATAIAWAISVTVAVARVDVDRRELDFRLVGRGKSAAPGRSASARQERAQGRTSAKPPSAAPRTRAKARRRK